MVEKLKAKRSRRPSDERLAAVLAALPAEARQEIREKFSASPKPKKPSGRPLVSLTGQRFGKWTVGPRAPNQGSRVMWWVICDCSNVAAVDSQNLQRGVSTQCRSCAGREVVKNLKRAP
jgi:hypothetical protein